MLNITNVCSWADLFKMQLLALAVGISGSTGQSVSHEKNEFVCSWMDRAGCWSASVDFSFHNDTLTCCQHDNEAVAIEFGNLTSIGDSNVTLEKIPVTREESLLGETESFDALKLFLKLDLRIDETIEIGITQKGISIMSEETEQRNKFKITLNVNATTNFAQSLMMIGFIKLKNPMKEFEKTPNSLSYLLSELGVLSVATYSSWNATLVPLEISYDYDLCCEESFERYAKEYTLESIAVKCVQLEENGEWLEVSEGNATHARCKCANCTVLGIKQELKYFEITLLYRVFFVLTPIILIVTCIFLGLTASLLVIYRKHMNSRETYIHTSITISFFLQGAVSTVSFIAYLSFRNMNGMPSALCEIIAIMLLYFQLTTSYWLLVEGGGLIVKIGLAVYVNYENIFSIRNLKIITVCAWLLPGIIIGVATVAEIHNESLIYHSFRYNVSKQRNDAVSTKCADGNYHFSDNVSKYKYCYAREDSVSYILCIFATGLAFLGNLLVSFYIARVVWKKSANRSNANRTTGLDRVCTTVHALVILSLSLGVPQYAGLAIREFTDDFLADIIIPNVLFVLHGPFVFYFYCVKNPELMQALKLSMNRTELRNSSGSSDVRQNQHTCRHHCEVSTINCQAIM